MRLDQVSSKVELLANILIIAFALLLAALLIKRNFFNYVTADPSAVLVPVGTKINKPEINWSKNGRTLLLVISTECHFCSESASFYQRLNERIREDNKVHLVIILPQEVDEGTQYLRSLQVPADGDIRQMAPESLGVKGVPAIMLTNETGTVLRSWVGKLTSQQESEVFTSLHQ
jgi:hypothetical protein